MRWWWDGEQAVAGRLAGLSDDDLAGASALPGWSRAHVVAHLARNADALGNLLSWARTGVETPMYASTEARNADIEVTAALPAEVLRADYADASARFADAIGTLPPEGWTARVRMRGNRVISAAEIPWQRAKEIWVHGTDLRAGLSFADLPAGLGVALVDDVLGTFAGRGEAPDATITATDAHHVWGSGVAPVRGPVAAIAAWVTRGDPSGLDGDVPELPAWL